MKKYFAVLLSLLLILSVAISGCSSASSKPAGSPAPQEKVYKVGLIQLVEHPSLDYVREGMLEALKANGFEQGKNIVIDYQNAQGDPNTLNNIAKKFVGDKDDLIISITTTATQAVAASTADIPIVFGAVTDPVAAKIVKSLDKPGTNVTGVSDLNPFDAQFEMMKKVVPNAKKIGIIYNTSEVNSQVQVDKAKEYGTKLGFEIVTAPITNSSEVLQAAQTLAGKKIDAYYVITDNTVATSINSLSKVAIDHKIPTIVAEDSQVQGGCLISIGIDYKIHGYQAGQMAVRVLKGAKPADTPIEYHKDLKVVINSETQKALGITLPEEYTKKATFVK
ncbi:MAG: ABC transporter substrate-binding protein [Peptococcaceae bacterium]|nr:ABC transporter substrate-binding protein [Peptococcaceae bacterium]